MLDEFFKTVGFLNSITFVWRAFFFCAQLGLVKRRSEGQLQLSDK